MQDIELDGQVKSASDRTGWLKTIVGAVVGVFVFGGVATGFATSLATKTDVQAAVSSHATSQHPADVSRIEALETWRSAHDAEHRADTYWMRQSVRILLEHQGLKPPPEPEFQSR